jgi:hypothetical protein
VSSESRRLRSATIVSIISAAIAASTLIIVVRGGKRFGTIDVQRINVVEPNGTLRMVISDKARFPGAIVKGKDYPHPGRQTAGMLFYNSEGTENGGLVFGGHRKRDGEVTSYGHLSFDRYEQDQAYTVDAQQTGSKKSVGIAFIDRPDWPITDVLKLPKAQWARFLATHPAAATERLQMERAQDGAVFLALRDMKGRVRLLLEVKPDGTPEVKLFDAAGKVIDRLPPSGTPGAR